MFSFEKIINPLEIESLAKDGFYSKIEIRHDKTKRLRDGRLKVRLFLKQGKTTNNSSIKITLIHLKKVLTETELTETDRQIVQGALAHLKNRGTLKVSILKKLLQIQSNYGVKFGFTKQYIDKLKMVCRELD